MKNINTTLYLILAPLLVSTFAQALPVLNLNSPGAESVTVFPDHVDKNLFYLSPAIMLIAEKDGKPQFNYTEYGRRHYREALVETLLAPSFDQAQIDLAKQKITSLNPLARFTGLPYANSAVTFGDILAPFLEASACTHVGGVIGEEQSCSFRLNPFGVTVFRKQFQRNLAITLSLEYTIDGVAQAADGSFTNRSVKYSVAGRLGGDSLFKHPELFHDEYGNPIQM